MDDWSTSLTGVISEVRKTDDELKMWAVVPPWNREALRAKALDHLWKMLRHCVMALAWVYAQR